MTFENLGNHFPRRSSLHSYKPLFLPLLLLLAASLCAAELTLPQALALADEGNPRLKAGSARIDVSSAGILTAKAYPNPEFSAQSGGQTFRVPGNVSGFVQSYTFAQPLELGSLRPTRIKLAENGRQVSAEELAAIRLQVLASVRRAFFQSLRAQREIDILTENLETVQQFRERIKVRVEVGETGRLELFRADSELATARAAVINARIRRASAIAQLRAAVGVPVPPALTLSGDLDAPSSLPSLDELRRQVLDRHPELSRAQAEIRRSQARLNYETAQRRPQPSLVAAYDRPPDVPIYRAGISITLPFWNRREGPIAEAVAGARAAEADAQSRRADLLAALDGAYDRYHLASQQVDTFQEGVLKAGEEGLRAAEAAYRLGERGILEVLDAQRVLRTVRLEFLNAQFDRQAALIDLDEVRAVDLRRMP